MKTQMKKINIIFIIVIAALVIRFFSVQGAYAATDRKNEKLEMIAVAAVSASVNETEITKKVTLSKKTPEKENIAAKNCEIQFDALKAINGDVCGWLRFEDGKIDLPIMDESQNPRDYYLHHDIYGEDSNAGELFVENTNKIMSRIIYGHNMKNGQMFGSLKYLVWDERSLKDPEFTIWTADGSEHIYEIISICITEDGSELYRIPQSNVEYDAYVDTLFKNKQCTYSNPDAGGIFERNGLVTLSTCYGAGSGERLIVVGVEKSLTE